VSRRKRAGGEEAEIDLTPMLDVVFIMLIFFIVTASFIKETGIEISRPDQTTDTPPKDDLKNIMVQISANNEIWIDGRRVDIRAVRANIERLYAENPKASVIIQAHNKSKADTYAAVADAARSANIYSVSLVTTNM